ncbi:DNA phosphorothioation-dependent restriction protein DptG [Stutzerimonas nitrititolerans]|uniref:DNA phosphorothioation-dependent restriction protein DptG n=1 Tax=Stutzerimonas nitrititolerans TaxID=2482751 RepID=A0AA42BBF6_9GAMM|nr:DNA phosphorothioation-dependent restriction protein DptG [Stutzerimonas nitrititolerans]MCO7543267.1 DNA phosphorothioation-dependent restriction protein DptG [Stutzerimonas nitrititolerans]
MARVIKFCTEIKNNPPSPFLPINTSKNDFKWTQVVALFVADLLGRSADGFDVDQLKGHCERHFRDLLDEPEQWDLLESMYFRGDALGDIAPELLLVAMQSQPSSVSDRRVADMFASLSGGGGGHSGNLSTPLNFIEQQILAIAEEHLTYSKSRKPFPPYLPFLADLFQQDLRFLVSKPKAMLSLIQGFLELYGFLYISQLALNLNEWKNGEPRSRPLYFILENERASTERSKIALRGYYALKEPIWRLFPMLAMLETLLPSNEDPIRLWEIPELFGAEESASPYTEKLAKFASEFAEDRNLSPPLTHSSALGWMEELLELSVQQFRPGSSRHGANQRVEACVHERLGGNFIHARGRAGRVLVLTQEAILLLANLAIGERSRLRMQELLQEFEKRGVYFDKQSEQALIEFFERIGNVERMSDSGDAVYVRKTI